MWLSPICFNSHGFSRILRSHFLEFHLDCHCLSSVLPMDFRRRQRRFHVYRLFNAEFGCFAPPAWNRQACRDHRIDFCHLLPGIHLEELWDLHSSVSHDQPTSRMHLSVLGIATLYSSSSGGTWRIWCKSYPYFSVSRPLLNNVVIACLAQDENRPQPLPRAHVRFVISGFSKPLCC